MMNYLNIVKMVFSLGMAIYKILKKKKITHELSNKELLECASEAIEGKKCEN